MARSTPNEISYNYEYHRDHAAGICSAWVCVELVSDNGRQFVAEEFKEFMTQNGVKHILIPAYHPSSNGQAENTVRTFKQGMKRAMRTLQSCNTSLNTKLCQFLLTYRTTPHCTTKRTPAELMGRQLRTRLDLLHPDASQRIERKASENEKPMRELDIGDVVLVRDYRQNTKKGIWTRGVVVLKLGPCTYNVQVDGNLIWKRHIDQMRLISNDSQDNKNELLARDFSELVSYPDPPLPREFINTREELGDAVAGAEKNEIPNVEEKEAAAAEKILGNENGNTSDDSPDSSISELPKLRRSTRQSRPPDYFRM
ncbi:uncharacterized protein K02A2.6-like [Macrobrachium nipponense]|uniref:uncharacterized protein K02A2.6-like n=1 Tax=Macrobrachium nipponense TaxID=159736 RepID=UPI0030C85BA8